MAPALHRALNLPLLRPWPTELPKGTPSAHPASTRPPASHRTPRILSSLVGLLPWRPLLRAARRPGLPGDWGRPAGAGSLVAGGWGTLLSAWGLAPAARVSRRPSGATRPITGPGWGGIRRNGRFLARVGVVFCCFLGALQLMQPLRCR